jgi:hypothetical protein
MTTSIRGRTVLRLSICSHRTTPDDIDLVFKTLTDLGRRLLTEERPTFDVASAVTRDAG